MFRRLSSSQTAMKPRALKRRHRRQALVIRRGGVDQELAADLVTAGIVHLRLDRETAGIAARAAAVLPGDDEAATGKCGNRSVLLIARRRGVDDELTADLAAVAMIHLAPDGIAAGVAARRALVIPDDDEITIGKNGDLRQVLTSRDGRVDMDVSTAVAILVENPETDARIFLAVGIARVRIGNHVAAVGE